MTLSVGGGVYALYTDEIGLPSLAILVLSFDKSHNMKTKNLPSIFLRLTLLVGLSFVHPIAHAQSLAIERFDSLAGPLHDYAGTTDGWFRNWSSQNIAAVNGYSLVDASPMTHTEVSGAGNYCVGGGDFTSTGRYFDVAGSFGDFEDANGRIGVGAIYFTFLIRKDEDTDTPIEIIFADDPGTAWAINQELIKVGYFGAPSNSGGDRFWSIAAFNEAEVDLAGTAITIGETYQIIVEINFAATTTINMWVNPTDGSPDLMNPDATVSSIEDLGFWNIVLYFDDIGTGHGSFDEFAFSEDLGTVLPVEYTKLYAVAERDVINLRWTTATELLNEKFIIQRSRDGRDWIEIGELAGNGTSSDLINYSYQDRTPEVGLNLYRLVQVDFDGTLHHSKAFRAHFGESLGLKINTFQKHSSIDFVANRDIVEVTVHDLQGRKITHQMSGARQFSIEKEGQGNMIYFVQVRTEGEIWREKVLSK